MHCKDLLINDGSYWQAIETIRECLPKFDIVPTLAYIAIGERKRRERGREEEEIRKGVSWRLKETTKMIEIDHKTFRK